jgi:hypothetical protein
MFIFPGGRRNLVEYIVSVASAWSFPLKRNEAMAACFLSLAAIAYVQFLYADPVVLDRVVLGARVLGDMAEHIMRPFSWLPIAFLPDGGT